jgi:hypothetical protein
MLDRFGAFAGLLADPPAAGPTSLVAPTARSEQGVVKAGAGSPRLSSRPG